MKYRIKKAVHWRNAKEALNLAANSERLANYSGFSPETREMHRNNAQGFRDIAASELRQIPAPFIALES